jgi:hypothetical protein
LKRMSKRQRLNSFGQRTLVRLMTGDPNEKLT